MPCPEWINPFYINVECCTSKKQEYQKHLFNFEIATRTNQKRNGSDETEWTTLLLNRRSSSSKRWGNNRAISPVTIYSLHFSIEFDTCHKDKFVFINCHSQAKITRIIWTDHYRWSWTHVFLFVIVYVKRSLCCLLWSKSFINTSLIKSESRNIIMLVASFWNSPLMVHLRFFCQTIMIAINCKMFRF